MASVHRLESAAAKREHEKVLADGRALLARARTALGPKPPGAAAGVIGLLLAFEHVLYELERVLRSYARSVARAERTRDDVVVREALDHLATARQMTASMTRISRAISLELKAVERAARPRR
jgi:hypothetical protein